MGVAYSALTMSPAIGSNNNRKSTQPLLQLWLYLSPLVLIFLALSLHYKGRKFDHRGDILNPYVCKPKSIHSSLATVCEDSTARPAYPQEVDKLDLAIDRHLTSAQCDAVFPGLYKEADRARDFYKAKGGVNVSDLDAAEIKGQARAMIYNNRLYVKSYSKFQQGTRTKAALAGINEALTTSLEPVPDIEFVLQTGDTGMLAGAPWVLGRKAKEETLVLMPDYGFFSWPEPGVGSFLEVQDKTLLYEAKLTWAEKIPKLFWRGALMIDLRKEFVDIASQYKWGAVADLDWQDLNGELLTPEEHCQYKYLGHVEGWAYSGRLKYLQQCRSVVIAHKMKYIQHFHHLFNADPTSPDQNLVIVPGKGFERLPETMQVLLDNDEWSERIANNSFNFYRHWLSAASIDCYWRRLFDRWAEVQNFEPVLTSNMSSFNSFILMGKSHWTPF